MNWVKYFVLGDPNTQNPNPGDVFIKDGAKYLITQAEHDVPIFYDVSPFGRDDRVWNLLLNEADCLIIAGRPRLGLFCEKSYCDYFFWMDVMRAKEKGIVIADLWAGSCYPGWDVRRFLELCEGNETLAEVIRYESMLDYVVVRDAPARDLVAQKSSNVDLLPCSTYWAADWYGVEPKEKEMNAITFRALPEHEWVLSKLMAWHRQLLDERPTFFLAHGTPDYEWFLQCYGPNKYLVCIYDPRSLLEFYARVDKLVSFRVHGSIPALSLGARVFHIATDTRSLSLNEFGVEPVFFLELQNSGALTESSFTLSALDKAAAREKFVNAFREKVASRVRRVGR